MRRGDARSVAKAFRIRAGAEIWRKAVGASTNARKDRATPDADADAGAGAGATPEAEAEAAPRTTVVPPALVAPPQAPTSSIAQSAADTTTTTTTGAAVTPAVAAPTKPRSNPALRGQPKANLPLHVRTNKKLLAAWRADPSIADVEVDVADPYPASHRLTPEEKERERQLLVDLERRGLLAHSPVRVGAGPGAGGATTSESASASASELKFQWADGPVRSDRYTVLINTFRGRDRHAAFLLEHYAKCSLLDRVVLLWNDVGRPVPPVIARVVERYQNDNDNDNDIDHDHDNDNEGDHEGDREGDNGGDNEGDHEGLGVSGGSGGIGSLGGSGRVAVALQRSSELTNRFRPQSLVRTDVIFSTDEDVRYACPLLDFGFQVAVQHPKHMVGFAPRKVVATKEGWYTYHWLESPRRGLYNTVWATKGGFLHREVHEKYFDNDVFAKVRSEVNRRVTGEDFLMSFTHAFFYGPKMSLAIMVPRHSFHNLYVVKSLGESTAKHRKGISVMLRRTVEALGADKVQLNALVQDWCEPYALPAKCDRRGSKEAFKGVYDWDTWWELPNSPAPFVQV